MTPPQTTTINSTTRLESLKRDVMMIYRHKRTDNKRCDVVVTHKTLMNLKGVMTCVYNRIREGAGGGGGGGGWGNSCVSS